MHLSYAHVSLAAQSVFICWGVVLLSVFRTVCVLEERRGGGVAEKGDGMSKTWTEG